MTQIIDQHLGGQQYQYNNTGQITQAEHPQGKENYAYDAALNIQSSAQQGIPTVSSAANAESTDHNNTVVHISEWLNQRGGALEKQSQNAHQNGSGNSPPANDYLYDKRGRLTEKTEHKPGFRPETTRYQWDADDRLSKLETPRGDRYRYTYDALGRRIGKTCETASSDSDHHPAGQHTAYLWDGATLVEEVPTYADGTPAWQQTTTWHYQPDSFVPMAKQSHEDDQLYYIVTDHLGTPKELVEEDGTPVWRQQYSVWGAPLNRADAANDSVNSKVDCALRFQGQYQDAESGLYYNYHRYYDPNTAQYLTPDPIGLLGGTRPMGYVHNPNGWVDPLGLAEIVYQLLDNNGKIVYFGITDRPGVIRANEHLALKDFSVMEVVAKGLSHGDARSLEGALIRNRLRERVADYSVSDSISDQLDKSGLMNKNRSVHDKKFNHRLTLKY